jgi:hypothetical protein
MHAHAAAVPIVITINRDACAAARAQHGRLPPRPQSHIIPYGYIEGIERRAST